MIKWRMWFVCGVVLFSGLIFLSFAMAQEEGGAPASIVEQAEQVAEVIPALEAEQAVQAEKGMESVPVAEVIGQVEQDITDAPVLADQAVQASIEPEAEVTDIASEQVVESKADWVWGEVISLDSDNKQFVIQHLDYDTYEEIKTVLKVDDKTLFENVSELKQINVGDHVTVDYKMQDGSNVAGLVVVEKKSDQKDARAAVEEPLPSESIEPQEASVEAVQIDEALSPGGNLGIDIAPAEGEAAI